MPPFEFDVHTARKRMEKLCYRHENPGKRGHVQEPEQWRWSSYQSYACGEEGAVKLNQRKVIKLSTQAA